MTTESVLGVNRSRLGQAWAFRHNDEDEIKSFVQRTGLSELQARLLAGRGVSVENVESFLTPRLRDQLPDPSTLRDMDKAASLVLDALEAKKKLTVFADYDVDGATSAAQIIRWGRHYGYEIGLYVPDRIKEGYGPSRGAFEALKADGVDLVLTVDCGATAHDALEAAADIELDTIVVDHHLMTDDGPPCAALVNPNHPDDSSGLDHLAAAGVTFMLIVALTREARRRNWAKPPDLLDFLDLTALGTICDVMPLTGLNRAFVYQGLKKLGQGKTLGLTALADVANVKAPYSTYHGGFVFGPRLNAGGRIGNPLMGAELLITENAQTAYGHAAELDRVNQERKTLQSDMLRECIDLVTPVSEDRAVIVAAMDGWHPGVIGIVAGRLKDRFGRPAIVIGIDEEGKGKGSGRSIKGVDLGQAIHAATAADILTSGGGHAMAAGLNIQAENIEKFDKFLNERLRVDVAIARENAALSIDGLLMPSALSLYTLKDIDKVGPFGVGNPKPVFALPDMVCTYAKRLKGGHLRCSFRHLRSGHNFNTVCFGAEENGLDELLTDPNTPTLHLAVRLSTRSWQGRETVDVQLVDVALV